MSTPHALYCMSTNVLSKFSTRFTWFFSHYDFNVSTDILFNIIIRRRNMRVLFHIELWFNSYRASQESKCKHVVRKTYWTLRTAQQTILHNIGKLFKPYLFGTNMEFDNISYFEYCVILKIFVGAQTIRYNVFRLLTISRHENCLHVYIDHTHCYL